MILSRPWRIVLLITGLLGLSLAVCAQDEERLAGAETIITRAQALGDKQDYNGAVNMLRQALDRYPTYPRLYTTLADWQMTRALALKSGAKADKGAISPFDAQEIFETLGLAMKYLPDGRDIRQRVSTLIRESFPMQLGTNGPLALPALPTPFTFTLSDPRLPANQRGLQQGLVTMQPLPVSDTYARDPKYGANEKVAGDPVYGGWTFQRVIYAYLYDRERQCWNLRFRVMWQDVPGKDEARLLFAQQTAQLLVRIAGVMQAYTDLTPRFTDDGVVNVWLTEKGEPGGESLEQHIYLYNIGTPRSATEWVRELAHEYGHQTLPPVGGYEQPEWGASGLLGEQLLFRWLTLNPDAVDESHPWVGAVDPSEVRTKVINPLIRKFAEQGPNAPQWRGTDAAAMDGYLGMALYLEQARGSRYLTLVLNKWMTSPTFAGPNGFLQSVGDMEEHVQSIDRPVILVRLGELPRDIPYHVYLSKGSWSGELQGQDLTPAKVKCTLDGKDLPLDAQGKFSATDLAVGWHAFRVSVVADAPDPELTALKLTKRAVVNAAAQVKTE